jgi:hypothetical protein
MGLAGASLRALTQSKNCRELLAGKSSLSTATSRQFGLGRLGLAKCLS